MKINRVRSSRRLWLTVGGIVVVLLAAMVFTLGSLNVPLNPEQGNAFVIFFAVSTLLAAALLVFSLILTRSLVRLWAERRSRQLGSRFKVKMVLGAMGISLLPILFLFFVSYALVNRTLNNWFPRPLELANEQTQRQLADMARMSREHLNRIAQRAVASADAGETLEGLDWSVDAKWRTNASDEARDTAALRARAPERGSRDLARRRPALHHGVGAVGLWKAIRGTNHSHRFYRAV
jgi:nitrogen fixation/metabolism regulation signal transduction histidine kinase